MKSRFLTDDLKVINIGLKSFHETLDEMGVPSIHVDWKPPLLYRRESFEKIYLKKKEIDNANRRALDIIQKGKPILSGMDIAKNVIPGIDENTILHAGPHISWDRMCGPMRGAIIGALIYEGFAHNPEDAERIAGSDRVKYSPCHEHASVGPMAGIISPNMPVFIILNEEYGNKSFTTMNEGLGKVLRYGAYGNDVINRLRWMRDVIYPILKSAIEKTGRVDLKNIIANALSMGDEVHNRNRAATSLFYRAIAPFIVKVSENNADATATLDFINSNDHFFLNLAMAASKATLDPCSNIPFSSIVNIMARNGTDFGIKVSGLGNSWFTGKADVPDALFFPGFSKDDANPDIGDSSITETNGLGGFAIASAPAIVQFVGGCAADATRYTKEMYDITCGENNVYKIPYLDFRGTPTGIDLLKVIETGILPFIDTGVAHKNPGIGQVGAGVLRAPAEPFVKAFNAFVEAFT